jgi:hypothetical protein
MERTLPCESIEVFWNSLDGNERQRLTEWFDTPGSLGDDESVLKDLSISKTTGQKRCLSDLKLLYSKYNASSQRALAQSVTNFNVSDKHFEEAKKLVKSSVDKTSVDNLRRYSQSPSTFVLEKKQ